MSYCIVFGCKNRNARKTDEQLKEEKAKNRKISFHAWVNLKSRLYSFYIYYNFIKLLNKIIILLVDI